MAETMYVCSNCRVVTQPRVKQHKVTFYQEVIHPARYKPVFKRGVFDHMECIDRGGKGKQITKELVICPECAAQKAILSGPLVVTRHDLPTSGTPDKSDCHSAQVSKV